jgi:hypothetical protein
VPTPFGPGCWQAFFEPQDEPAHNEVESTPDGNDGRMQQTWYFNGTLWGSADTAVRVGGKIKGRSIWLASEYIGQRCTLAEYFPNPDLTDFGSCNNTRTSLANWYTRITKLR